MTNCDLRDGVPGGFDRGDEGLGNITIWPCPCAGGIIIAGSAGGELVSGSCTMNDCGDEEGLGDIRLIMSGPCPGALTIIGSGEGDVGVADDGPYMIVGICITDGSKASGDGLP